MAETRVMLIGDSITVGSDGIGGYRVPLRAAAPGIRQVGSRGDDTLGWHEGINGVQIGALRPIVLALVDSYAPKGGVIMAGTNDVSLSVAVSLMWAEALLFAEQLLAKASIEWVIVSTIAPRFDGDAVKEAATIEYNSGLVAAFAGASPGIRVFDVCEGLRRRGVSGMEVDGIHPNSTGYQDIAEYMLAAIRMLFVETGLRSADDVARHDPMLKNRC